jgi:hypothetical protein
MENRETNTLNLINQSLGIVSCSTTLSNHDISRLIRFVSQFKLGYKMSFVNICLILLSNIASIDVKNENL